MQISVTLKKDQIHLPIATGETIQGLIYRALSEDRNFSTKIHDMGNSFDGRKYKLMTFSELRGRYQAEGQYITYFSRAELEIRSANDYLVQLLFSYFLENKRVKLGNNDVETEVRLINQTVFDNRVEIRTLSPITTYITEKNGQTKFYSPYDTDFYHMIRVNAKRKWSSMYGDDKKFDFNISPASNRFVKRATRFKDTFITAWHGKFVIEGSPDVLNFLYNVGIGSKNSQGFGMFEVLN